MNSPDRVLKGWRATTSMLYNADTQKSRKIQIKKKKKKHSSWERNRKQGENKVTQK